jgi:tRNA(Ile)-lysidine synthase|tara:strand:+ start:188 stop:1210 length:1023 start_codon:yes stop_codon:yes gene_type:complete
MSPKNLIVKNKTHKLLLNKLKNKKILNIYKKFESNLNINENFIVAVSGGPDSLALAFLSKIYSIKKKLDIKYYIIDHGLRKNSASEAKYVQNKLKSFSINLNILKWSGSKPKRNIQSIARNKRYKLLIEKSKELRIKNVLTGHQLDDLFENFFIRILRGSGLNGLISLDQKIHYKKINIIRPLIYFNKEDLIYIAELVFKSYIIDPFNEDDKFKRVRIRNFLKQLKSEGFDREKFILTIKNLKIANESIKFYTEKNLKNNISFLKNKSVVIKENFFSNSEEVVFRSITKIIQFVGKRHYPSRGKKVEKVINMLNSKSPFKITLGGCIIMKFSKTIIITKE